MLCNKRNTVQCQQSTVYAIQCKIIELPTSVKVASAEHWNSANSGQEWSSHFRMMYSGNHWMMYSGEAKRMYSGYSSVENIEPWVKYLGMACGEKINSSVENIESWVKHLGMACAEKIEPWVKYLSCVSLQT